MPARVYEGDLIVPAGTLAAAPVSAVLQMPQGTLAKITLVVPQGHCGLTGIRVTLAGTPIIPYGGNPWLIANDYTDSWELDQEVNPGQVALVGYNTDVYAHCFYVRALWVPPAPGPAVTAAIAAVTAAPIDLSGAVQYTPAPAASPLPAAATGLSPGPVCYDADGNVVDCSPPPLAPGPVPLPIPTPVAVPPPAGPPPPVPLPTPLPPAPQPRKPPPPPRKPPPVPHGPYRHIATGKLSLDEIAHADKTTADDIIKITRAAKGMTRAELSAFNSYVREGAARKMHKGLAYYSEGSKE